MKSLILSSISSIAFWGALAAPLALHASEKQEKPTLVESLSQQGTAPACWHEDLKKWGPCI